MSTPNQSDSNSGMKAVYGLFERIYLTVWAILSLFFLVKFGSLEDGSRGLMTTLALLACGIVIPQITFRIGNVAQAIGRFLLGLAVAMYGYETAAIFIKNFRHVSYEAQMLAMDEALFGGHASVWLEAVHHPVLTEYLQAVYIFYFPQVVLVAGVFIYKREFGTYYEYLLSMMIAFMVTHSFYVLVPVQSPFLVVDQFPEALNYSFPLEGLWVFDGLRSSLLNATTMRHDCFPSGHTMHSLVTLYFAYKADKRLGIFMTVIAGSIIFSTLYLRYHYAIDLVFGAAFAAIVIFTIPPIGRYAYAKEAKPEDEVVVPKSVSLS